MAGSSSGAHRACQLRIALPNLDSQRALPNGGAHLVEGEIAGDALMQAKSMDARCRQNQRVAIAAFKLAQPCVQIAAHGEEFQVRPQPPELGLPARAAGAHARARRELLKRFPGGRNEHVARIFTRRHRSQNQAFRLNGRQVFEAVDGKVHFACQQSFLDFLDE